MSSSGKILRRSSVNREIGGVCGGIAEYLDLDPTAVRVAYVLLSLLTAFAGTLVYIVLWVVIPEREYY
jgi:phage shock protein C